MSIVWSCAMSDRFLPPPRSGLLSAPPPVRPGSVCHAPSPCPARLLLVCLFWTMAPCGRWSDSGGMPRFHQSNSPGPSVQQYGSIRSTVRSISPSVRVHQFNSPGPVQQPESISASDSSQIALTIATAAAPDRTGTEVQDQTWTKTVLRP